MKRKKFRANIKDFRDADYKKKLDKETLEWYNKFEAEYYCNEINREGSLHKEILQNKTYTCDKCKEEVNAFDRAKKQTFDATNAQNRDGYGISATGSYLNFVEDESFYEQLTEPVKKVIDKVDADEAFNILLTQTLGELEGGSSRDTKTVLQEYAMELVKLGASLSRVRTNSILKKREQRKKEKEEKLEQLKENE